MCILGAFYSVKLGALCASLFNNFSQVDANCQLTDGQGLFRVDSSVICKWGKFLKVEFYYANL